MPNYSINLKGIDTTTVHVDCGHLHLVRWPELSKKLFDKIDRTLVMSSKIVYVTDALKKESEILAPEKHNNNCITASLQFDINEVGTLKHRNKKFDLITVSTSQERKNWPELFRIILNTKRPLKVCLVVDSIFDATYNEYLQLIRQKGHQVTLYRSIEREELNELYQASIYYLQCSKYEGFCVPVFEAIAHGATALVKPTDILEEIYGEFAFFYKTIDEVSSILNKNELRKIKANEIRSKHCDVEGFINKVEAFANE